MNSMPLNFGKNFGAVLIFGLLLQLGSACKAQAATLLTYWDFNSVATGYSTSLGSFYTSSGATANGEYYNATTKLISSNSSFGLLSGSIDMNGINLTPNGGAVATSWGVYTDSTVNRYSSDTTSGGSLLLGNNNTAQSLVLNLSSVGYQDLSLSYAYRNGGGGTVGMSWFYSLDGSNWTTMSTTLTGGNGFFRTVSLDLSSYSELDNQSTFYLKATFTNQYSMGLDNIQLTAATAIPEPTSFGLLASGAVVMLLCLNRKRKGAF